MIRYMILLGMVSGAAVAWVGFFNANSGHLTQTAQVPREDARHVAQDDGQAARPAPLSGVERLRADARGHHVAFFRLNGERVEGMVDTGATTVAINMTTARRAGVELSQSDFIYQVETANGIVRAARAILDEVSIGSIRVYDVEAMVLEDRALGTVLIGMSFMGRLRGFSHENGTLVLER